MSGAGKTRKNLARQIEEFVDSIPGGLGPRTPQRDWRSETEKLPHEERAAVEARRATAEGKLVAIRGELMAIANDHSIPKRLRNRAKIGVSMIDDDRFPPETRVRIEKLFTSENSGPLEAPSLDDIFPPGGGGALPVPDDTPWAPPRRENRR